MVFLLILGCSEHEGPLLKSIQSKMRTDSGSVRVEDLTSVNWDRVCAIPNGASLESINQLLQIDYSPYWSDIGDRIIFLNKGEVTYSESYFPNPEAKDFKVLFSFPDTSKWYWCTDSKSSIIIVKIHKPRGPIVYQLKFQ
jgi:hypothetical protein